MSQRPGDIGSFLLRAQSQGKPITMEEAARLAREYELKQSGGLDGIVATNDPRFNQKKQEPNNPVSEVEGLFGIRMTKGQKWAAVIGITLALYGVTIYLNKK